MKKHIYFAVASLLLNCIESAPSAIATNTLLDHTRFATTYCVVDSGCPGPTVMVVAGVHGDEPAGAEAAAIICQWPIRKGRLVVLPRANALGLRSSNRLVPGASAGEGNLNRNYPSTPQTSTEARGELAQAIWRLATEFKPDWVLDLHEGRDFRMLNTNSVGSTVICFPLTHGQAAADAMIAAVNGKVTNATHAFTRRNMPVDGSIARAAGECLRIPGMTIETTKKHPLPVRVYQHQVAIRELLRHLEMIRQNDIFIAAPVIADANLSDGAGR